MAVVQGTFKIRRYWLDRDHPSELHDTLNLQYGYRKFSKYTTTPYVDINFYGDNDKNCTMMELRYGEWIIDREELTYTVEGDDGLE